MNSWRRPAIKEITWDEHAEYYAAMWGLTRENVESVVRNPAASSIDPSTSEHEYMVLRHRTGDIIVVTGYLVPDMPKVIFVTTVTGAERVAKYQKAKVGNKPSSMPVSYRDLNTRIRNLGYTIEPGGKHLRVLDSDKNYVYTLPNSASDHRSLANTWRGFLRVHMERTKK